MFTGIIQHLGRITALTPIDAGVRLVIDRTGWKTRVFQLGESIAVDGCCLTVVESSEMQIAFEAVPQTLTQTNLSDKKIGDAVNLEPALAAGDPMGGHVVQGHIDGIARIETIEQNDAGHKVTLRPPANLLKYIVPRGSITLDGVSLTLADVRDDCFTVALIPTTLKQTTLSGWQLGQRINVETDILARTIVHRLELQAEPNDNVDMKLLEAAGFTHGS